MTSDPNDAEEPFSDPSTLRREGLIAVRPSPGSRGRPRRYGPRHLTFTPAGPEVRVPPGVSVFDAASWNGIAIDSTCGGHGTCKKCRVRVTNGSVPVARLDGRCFDADELRSGWRLACLAQADGPESRSTCHRSRTRPKAATVGVGRQVILRPAIQKRYVELSEPTPVRPAPDLDRLLAAIDDLELRADLYALRRLPGVLRSADFSVTAVVVDDMLIDVEPGDTTADRCAIAFDLGTTTVVATLLDPPPVRPSRSPRCSTSSNRSAPTSSPGSARPCWTPTGSPSCRDLAHETLDELAGEVCKEGGVDPHTVYEVALAGNATMVSLALGIDPEPLGVAPFIMPASLLPEVLAERPRCRRRIRGRGRSSSPRSARTWAATSWRVPGHRGWTATSGSGCSSTSGRTARSCSVTACGSWRRRRRPDPRSRVVRSGAGCGPPTVRSRSSRSTRTSTSA